MSSDLVLKMKASGPDGSHSVCLRQGELSVEWYDFADDAPYESLNYLDFGQASCDAFAKALGLAPGWSREALASAICERFDFYWDVREFADAHSIEYDRRVNFWP